MNFWQIIYYYTKYNNDYDKSANIKTANKSNNIV